MVKCRPALHRLIKWLNSYTQLLPLDTSPLLSNSWLAGLVNADGYLKVSLYKNVTTVIYLILI
jgi:hypothetical protein